MSRSFRAAGATGVGAPGTHVPTWRRRLRVLAAAVGLVAASAAASPASAQIDFSGCFVSGPSLDGTPNATFDSDVNTLTAALLATGSWRPGGITTLLNGQLADIFGCVTNAKQRLQPGNEFVFYFAGHGGNNFVPDPAEPGDAGGDEVLAVGSEPGRGRPLPLSDDVLSGLLSGFRQSVTISVVLDACHSWAFAGGANDLGSVTQRGSGGEEVPAGPHLALATSTSPDAPICNGGFTTRLAEGIRTGRADRDGDSIITTQEATQFAGGFTGTGPSRCWPDGGGCPAPEGPQEPSYLGPNDCDRRVEVCPVVAATIPEPSAALLTAGGLVALGAAWRHNRGRSAARRPRR